MALQDVDDLQRRRGGKKKTVVAEGEAAELGARAAERARQRRQPGALTPKPFGEGEADRRAAALASDVLEGSTEILLAAAR